MAMIFERKGKDTEVAIGRSRFGKGSFGMIAGPCAVESLDQLEKTANFLKGLGVDAVRGMVFKPRTSPYSFQGLGHEGFKILQKAKQKTGASFVTEILDAGDIKKTRAYADAFQIGARNMSNFALLKAVSKTDLPVILKRGMSATLDEFLNAAEYILQGGNKNIILCERGIRTYSDYTRNTLDISIVPELKLKTHLPVIVDPSHAVGKKELIGPVSKAAIAAGADGLLVEVHPYPEKALSDAAQQLTFDEFRKYYDELKPYIKMAGKKV